MPKQVRNSLVPDDPAEVKLQNDSPDEDEQPSRDLNLNDLADRMDNQARSRAVQRILTHHAALRSDIDRLCAKVGSQAETIAQLESRLALLEDDGKADEKTPANTKNHEQGKARGLVFS